MQMTHGNPAQSDQPSNQNSHRIKTVHLAKHAVTIHFVIGVVHVLVALGGLLMQHAVPLASMGYGFFTDGQEQASRGGPQGSYSRSWVVKVTPSMMIQYMFVQCQGVEYQAAIKEGYPELIVRSDNEPALRALRDAVAKVGRSFWCQAGAQAPPKYDSASAGTVENAIRQVTENVRTLVIAARGLRRSCHASSSMSLCRGVCRCVRFAEQIIPRTVKGRCGLTAIQHAYPRKADPRATLAAW